MFEFLRVQYELGKLDNDSLYRYVEVGCITAAEYKQICGKEVQ